MDRKAGIFVLCIYLFASACLPSQPAQPPVLPAAVNLAVVKALPVYYYDKFPGTTEALSQVNIYPEVQGYITGILFKEGAHVRKGQLLYEIDKRIYQAAYDQAEANLKVAQGNTVQAQQDADRYVYLNKQKAVAEQLYDHAVIALDNAKSAEKAAEQAVKSAKTNLAYSNIFAPFDGTVGFSQVKLGNMVTVGQTILNTISTDDPMAVDFLVNEKQLSMFEGIEKSQGDPKDSLFTILMPDNTLYPYPGKISIIDRAVDPQTGAIRIRLEFPNSENILKVGMSCVVRVHNRENAPQIVIPSKAVVEQMGEYFVFIKKDTAIVPHSEGKTEGGTPVPATLAMQKKVQLGMNIGANVIVTSGLEEGESIVVDGVQNLHDGSRIAAGGKKPGSDGQKKGTENK